MPSTPSVSDVPGSPARTAALAVLLACQSGDKVLDAEMEKRVSDLRLDTRDRSLAMELVYGTLRRQETLDWRLTPLLKKPLARLPLVIQYLLRLGIYQLLYLDRVPPSAAVHETVALTKSYTKALKRDWSGFVNAVLRNVLRTPAPEFPDPQVDPAHALSVRHSVPLWLCTRWIDRLGVEQAEVACRATAQVPLLTVRVNRLRTTREQFLERLRQQGIVARPTTISPIGVVLEKGGAVTSIPGFQEGDFYVEDEAAQLIPPLLDPQSDDCVFDACAAPGGKTTHLAELMNNRGLIIAVDRQRSRLENLQDNCHRLGLTTVTTIVGDMRQSRDVVRAIAMTSDRNGRPSVGSAGGVDRLLLDAPCSGLGVLRRHPEAKLHKHPAMFSRHHNHQQRILTTVAAALRPGGVLVYSTCSTEREETEDVVTQFCHDHPSWVRESVAPWLPPAARSFVTAHGALSTMGNTVGMDGFYAARLRKVS